MLSDTCVQGPHFTRAHQWRICNRNKVVIKLKSQMTHTRIDSLWWRAGCIDVTAAAADEEVVDAGDADDRGVTAEVVAACC